MKNHFDSGLARLGLGSSQLASACRGEGSVRLCPSRPGFTWLGLAPGLALFGLARLGSARFRPGQAGGDQGRPGEAGMLIL